MTDNQTSNLSPKELFIYIVKTIAVMIPATIYAIIFCASLLTPHEKGFHPSTRNYIALLFIGMLSIYGGVLALNFAYKKIFSTGFNVSRLM